MCVPGKRQITTYRFPQQYQPQSSPDGAPIHRFPFLINTILKNEGCNSPQTAFFNTTPSPNIQEIARNIFEEHLAADAITSCSVGQPSSLPINATVGCASQESQPLTVSQQQEIDGEIPLHERKKRKRKPQQPGMTAKMKERQFVKHHYHDHANDVPNESEGMSSADEDDPKKKDALPFPLKLHRLLESVGHDGFDSVVSWQPHGRSFVIHKPKAFANVVMPRYFGQSKYTSFQRQLNLYGFIRISRGRDRGGYYNELFLRGREFLSRRMSRIKVKGTGYKAASSPEDEPNFYAMSPVGLLCKEKLEEEDMKSLPALSSQQNSSIPIVSPQQSAIFNVAAYQNMSNIGVSTPSPSILNDTSSQIYYQSGNTPFLNSASCNSSENSDESDEFFDDIVDLLSESKEEDYVIDDADLGLLLETIIA